jgi:ribose-phosphate pyrophosphokinase
MILSLNIDGNFIPTTHPHIEFRMMQFKGGEMHIKLNNEIQFSEYDTVIITNRFRTGDDIMKVLIAKDALERKGVRRFQLVMPYAPYARQDRQCDVGESFTLKVFASLINFAGFEKITIIDSHSEVTPALLNNCVNVTNDEYVRFAIQEIGIRDIILVSPDSGANKKSNKLYDNLKVFSKIVKCDKRRNVVDGSLSEFEVFTNDLNGGTCLIVDDICDGGRTFIGIADELKKKNAGDIYLFITHGIFSYGLDELKKCFKKIYCTNSFRDVDDEFIKQFKIQL